MRYDVIEIQPTLFTGAQQNNDLLADWTKIKLPARAVKVINIQGIIDDTQANNDTLSFLFAQQNTNSLGTLGDQGTSLTFAQLLENKILGKLDVDFDDNAFAALDAGTSPGNMRFGSLAFPRADQNNEFAGVTPPLVLKSGSTDNVVYLGIFADGTDGATVAADSMRIFLHVEY